MINLRVYYVPLDSIAVGRTLQAQDGSRGPYPGPRWHQCCFLLREDFVMCFCMSNLCAILVAKRKRPQGQLLQEQNHVFLFPVKVLKQVAVWLLAIFDMVTLHVLSSTSPGRISVTRPEVACAVPADIFTLQRSLEIVS